MDVVASHSDLKIALVLLSGFILKLLCLAWRADIRSKETELSIWQYFSTGPRRWRFLGTLQITLMMVFVVPDEMFNALMNHAWGGHRVGHIGTALLGFITDDIFALLYAVNQKVLYTLSERFGIEPPSVNGEDKKDNGND